MAHGAHRAGLGLALAWALAACGHHAASPAPVVHDDAAAARRDAAAAVPAELPERPLGLPEQAAFGWERGAGQPAYRTARAAEARGDWPAVLVACRQARAADPGHLGAAYLEAVALAKTGQLGAVTAPLQLAAAGDFAKWGDASLAQPALQPFLATPEGQVWRRRVEADRVRFAAVLGHALIVRAQGDLYAVDPAAPRWYRLTHTGRRVIATYRPVTSGLRGKAIAYVARVRERGGKDAHYEVGTIDLATGAVTGPDKLAASPAVHIAFSSKAGAHGGFLFQVPGQGGGLWTIDPAGHLGPPPAHAEYAAYILGETWLDVTGRHVSLRHGELGFDATADWDDGGLASAMRIAFSNRIVAAPSPGRIDGYTVAWAPGRAHVAFVAELDEHCTPGADLGAAYVADVATGAVRELERAKGGLALEWIDATHLAIAGDHGVSIVDLAGGAAHPLAGAEALVTMRRKPACVPEPPEPAEGTPGDDN